MTTYTDIILQDTSNNYFIPYGLINRLGDVDISNPTTGQNLTYDATSGKWKNTLTSATVAWGGVTGNLSDQTDLTNALNGKQDSLVSGTSIKTINSTSLLGSGDISVLQNTATGTNSLTILGNASTNNSTLGVGYEANTTASYATALGIQSSATAQSAIAIGRRANAKATNAIQLGYGTNNTADSLQILSYNLLDTSTGLIPDARISSNIARTSAIPTQASDISAADNTLSNVSSIDSNSAVQTALDGKVSKSGDTMTGDLNISGDNNVNIRLSNTGIVKGTIPSTQTWQGVHFNDSTNDAGWENTRIGVIESSVDTSGNTHVNVLATPNVIGNTTQDGFKVQMTPSGVASCTFPNTTCCDGQWVTLNQNIINSATSANGSTYLGPYTVNVPNDGYKYELLIEGQISSGSTIGNWVVLIIQTSYTTITCVQTIAQRAAQIWGTGSCIIPITADRKLWVGRTTNQNGNIQRVTVVAYRRIGTNS